jgi:DNA helicase HerA-like ATPase
LSVAPPTPDVSTELRRELRRSSQVVPLAWSAGGRRFSFQAPLTLALAGGAYALLTTDDGVRYLGQVLDRAVVERSGPSWTVELEADDAARGGRVREARFEMPIRMLEGSGELLARLEGDDLAAARAEDAFREADLAAAPGPLVAAFRDRLDAGTALLDIGSDLAAGGGRARLRADGFARHTFLCGQSGAGKTFALGVILERLLLETDLRLVAIDPNGDFTGLGATRAGAEPADLAGRYRAAARGVRVFSQGHEPLRLRFGELTPETQAAVVGLDPLADREEYGAFLRLAGSTGSLTELREAAVADLSGEGRQIALRIDNLGVGGWGVWGGPGEESLLDAPATGARATVADLSSLDTQEEQSVAAGAVLTRLWGERAERRPVLIVIDEAHNVCPRDPGLPLGQEAREQVMRIAGEGRKYGLYLLLVTQRPDKLEPNALTQCDNLVLLRLNGAADVERLATAFSFVPRSLLAEAPTFAKGEALVAGAIAGRPTRAAFEGRLSPEGGGDVPTDWAGAAGKRTKEVAGG